MTHLTAETWLRIGRRFAALSYAAPANDNAWDSDAAYFSRLNKELNHQLAGED